MAERIRITTDCDGLRSAHPDSEKLYRFAAGSELPLLRDDDRLFYQVAVGGRPAFVLRSCAVRIEADAGGEASAVLSPPTAQAAIPIAIAQSPPTTTKAPRRWGWFFTLLRLAALLTGLGMVMGGVGMIIGAAPSVLAPESDIGAGVGLGIGGAIVLALGLVLVRLTFRPFLQAVLTLTGLSFAIGGFELLVFAVPLVRMSSVDIDPDRARVAFPTSGAILLVLGVAMVFFALVRWLRNQESRRRWPEVARWAAIIFGGLLVLAGSGTPISIAATTEEYTPTVQDAAAIGAVMVLTLLPGAILGYHGLTMISHRQEGPFRFLPAGALLILFALVIGLGAIVAAVEEPLVWLMSGAHGAVALLPAVALVALASRGGLRRARPIAGLTHRHVWVALALGIAVVTTVAALLDGFVAEALVMGFLAVSGAFDGLRSFSEVTDVLANADRYLSRGQEVLLLLSVVVVMAPIMEEGFKALGVALVLPRRPTPAAALTLGVAVGAGFGVFEATVYGLGGLDPDSTLDWWGLMLIRAGATSMHALNTGLLGLALYYDRSQGRLRRAFLLYLAAVALHGLWNALAVLAGSRVIFSFEGLTDQGLAWVIFAVMMPLGLVMVGALYAVARRVYEVNPKVGDTEASPLATAPLPAFEPWLS